jgi:hypothetical protein
MPSDPIDAGNGKAAPSLPLRGKRRRQAPAMCTNSRMIRRLALLPRSQSLISTAWSRVNTDCTE